MKVDVVCYVTSPSFQCDFYHLALPTTCSLLPLSCSVLTITDVVTTLAKLNKITSQTVEDVISFMKTTPTAPPPTAQPHSKVVRMSFEQRMEQASHPVAKQLQLFKIMADKSSNLCLSADVTTMQELLQVSMSRRD